MISRQYQALLNIWRIMGYHILEGSLTEPQTLAAIERELEHVGLGLLNTADKKDARSVPLSTGEYLDH